MSDKTVQKLPTKASQSHIAEIDELYKKFDSKFNTEKDEAYASLVNFSLHKESPFQRWHYYQEGYSPELVKKIKNSLFKNNDITILDPFVGSGSTLVAAQSEGIKSIGIEINPFSYIMAKAKSTDYSQKSLNICKGFVLPKYTLIKDVYSRFALKIIDKLYSEENLSKIELIKKSIENVRDADSKLLLFASLLSILEKCSNYKKGGNGLKRRKNPHNLDVYTEFELKLKDVIEDIENKSETAKVELYNSSVTEIKNLIEDNSIDLTVFSPPYANCFDYFEVYKIELWIGGFIKDYASLRQMRKSALTSNLNANLKQEADQSSIKSEIIHNILEYIEVDKLWDKRIHKMLLLYFIEMQSFLNDLFQKQKDNSFVAIIVGNSAYSGIPIATDLILAEIGASLGFKVKKVIVARNNETSSQQYSKISTLVKYIRESIVILEK